MPPNGTYGPAAGPPGPAGQPQPNQTPAAQPFMVDTAHPQYEAGDTAPTATAAPPAAATSVPTPAPVSSPPSGGMAFPPAQGTSPTGPAFPSIRSRMMGRIRRVPPPAPMAPAFGQPANAPYGPPTGIPSYTDAPAAYGYQAHPSRPGRKRAYAGLTMIAVLVIGGITGVMNVLGSQQVATAEIMFEQALDNALQTKSYTQRISNELGSVERRVDVSDVRNPKVSGTASLKQADTELEAYATLKDTFVCVKESSAYAKPEALGSWVQVRRNGAVLDQSGVSGQYYDQQFAPMVWMFDSVIHGNYEQIDRANLMQFLREKNIFRIDPSKAEKHTLDGHEVLRYSVIVDGIGHNELFKKVAELNGLDQKQIFEIVTLAKLSGSNTQGKQFNVSVDTASQRFVKVEYTEGGKLTSMILSNFDTTQVDAAPTPKFDWTAFTQAAGGR